MIKNASKDTVIADSYEECRTWWEKTRGLMFRKEIIPLIFFFDKKQHVQLHSYFVKEPIDLIFLDDTWEVVEMKSDWQPKGTYSSRREASFLLELPQGSIALSNTEVGDIVHIK